MIVDEVCYTLYGTYCIQRNCKNLQLGFESPLHRESVYADCAREISLAGRGVTSGTRSGTFSMTILLESGFGLAMTGWLVGKAFIYGWGFDEADLGFRVYKLILVCEERMHFWGIKRHMHAY